LLEPKVNRGHLLFALSQVTTLIPRPSARCSTFVPKTGMDRDQNGHSFVQMGQFSTKTTSFVIGKKTLVLLRDPEITLGKYSRWFNFDCSTAESLYGLNDQLGEGLATYNGAESQDVPSYSSANQPSYQTPKAAPAPKKAPAPKPKSSKPNGKSGKTQPPKNNYGAPAGNNYGAPAGNNYGAPSAGSNYDAPPAGSYGAPSSYGSPAIADQPSGSNYGAPTNGEEDLPDYSASPSENYGAPAASEYGAPAEESYGAPEPPVGDYASSGRSGRQRSGKSAFGRRG
jgi:hypothetical protein